MGDDRIRVMFAFELFLMQLSLIMWNWETLKLDLRIVSGWQRNRWTLDNGLSMENTITSSYFLVSDRISIKLKKKSLDFRSHWWTGPCTSIRFRVNCKFRFSIKNIVINVSFGWYGLNVVSIDGFSVSDGRNVNFIKHIFRARKRRKDACMWWCECDYAHYRRERGTLVRVIHEFHQNFILTHFPFLDRIGLCLIFWLTATALVEN